RMFSLIPGPSAHPDNCLAAENRNGIAISRGKKKFSQESLYVLACRLMDDPNIQPSRYRIPISLFTSFSIDVSATCEIGMFFSNFARCNAILIVSRRTSSFMVPSLLYADQ